MNGDYYYFKFLDHEKSNEHKQMNTQNLRWISIFTGNGRTRYQTGSMMISNYLNHATHMVKEQTLFLKGLRRPKTKKGYIVNNLRRTLNSAFSLLHREEYIWIVEQAEESAVGFMSYELGSDFLADESGQILVRDVDSAAVREQENAAPAELPESLEEVRWVDLEFEGEVVESTMEEELREALSADAVGVFMEMELNSRERDSLYDPTQILVEGPEGAEVQHPVPEDFSPTLTVDGEDSLSLSNRARTAREAQLVRVSDSSSADCPLPAFLVEINRIVSSSLDEKETLRALSELRQVSYSLEGPGIQIPGRQRLQRGEGRRERAHAHYVLACSGSEMKVNMVKALSEVRHKLKKG
uniref:Uncharacterized protein n=1 Tax=Chromera velia CCMP2878 TaxID=1169474 RepID=A0A0G4HQB8_9ALVE|eukprot:Cvel_7897.t1-p1 / transcript=Cvel_7897.t1 / gene=Cvel_7897 / organism=Chromera_velia_CCMP2878 / gene_product=hypothetical protein / transcript_product=hypothetical protein / location=Cvel_scaffold423:57461-58522(+) / protein_length=354 / sequence_SO=supercontig / SO=protein_coding / is_pseudo=false